MSSASAMLQMAGLSSGHDAAVTLGGPEVRSTFVLCFRAGPLVAVESVNRPTGLARVEQRFAQDSSLEGDGFEPSVPRQKDRFFRDSSFPTCAPPPLRKRSPPRPAAASPSCRSRSDERRTHSPTWRSSRSPDRRHHPFALITALCFFFISCSCSCSCAVALSRGQGSTLSQTVSF